MPRRFLLLALLGLAAGQPAAGQDPARVNFDSYTLANGLRVILSPDTTVQVVTVNVWYNVGSRNERPGRTGFAHLFEHMLFQGSANVPKGAHMQWIERAGGNLNGSTTPDRTNYYQTLPSNRLNLGLWLEADRMRSLAVTEENLQNQTEAVKEEKRLNFENPPYVGAYLDGLTAIYDSTSCFAYSHTPIGSMADLDAATTADVKEFFDLYYAPNNAILTITGDFAPAEARALVEQYFGSIPRGQEPPPVSCDQPFNTGEKRLRVADAKATLPAMLAIYRVPPTDHADIPALELLSSILGGGESSRLNRALVRDSRAAVAAQVAFFPFGPVRGPGAFALLGISNQGVSPDSVEVLMRREVARVVESGVTEEELTKARNIYRAGAIGSRQTTMGVAEELQSANLFFGDPDAVNRQLPRYMAVTVADIQRVAARYLRADNSVVVLIATPGATP